MHFCDLNNKVAETKRIIMCVYLAILWTSKSDKISIEAKIIDSQVMISWRKKIILMKHQILKSKKKEKKKGNTYNKVH